MPRVIRYFDKATESYAGEVILPEIPLEQLQHLFGVEAENPMYDSFLVDEREESFFKDLVDVEFILDRFDYYMDYDA